MKLADPVLVTIENPDGKLSVTGMVTMISANQKSLMVTFDEPLRLRAQNGGLLIAGSMALLLDDSDDRYHELLTNRIVQIEVTPDGGGRGVH